MLFTKSEEVEVGRRGNKDVSDTTLSMSRAMKLDKNPGNYEH